MYRFSDGANLLKTVSGGCFPDPEPLPVGLSPSPDGGPVGAPVESSEGGACKREIRRYKSEEEERQTKTVWPLSKGSTT